VLNYEPQYHSVWGNGDLAQLTLHFREGTYSFTLLTFCPRENKAGTHCIGSCVGPEIGLDFAENKTQLPVLENEPRFSLHPVRSQFSIETKLLWLSLTSLTVLTDRMLKIHRTMREMNYVSSVIKS